jgi:hypothetical protein
MTQTTTDRRKDVQAAGTWDIYIEIDIDCEELVDACGLDYKPAEEDSSQNEICLSLTKDEYYGSFGALHLDVLNEVFIGEMLLNPELGEYVTKVTIYKPNGDIISFS